MRFIFKPAEIKALCDMVEKIILEQPMVLKGRCNITQSKPQYRCSEISTVNILI